MIRFYSQECRERSLSPDNAHERIRSAAKWLAFFIVIIASCQPVGANHAGEGGDGGDIDSSSSTEGSPAVDFPRPCADIYNEDLLPGFYVEVTDAEWAAIEQECTDDLKLYHPVVFRYEDETVDAMMRLKGAWSRDCDKMQFVVSFNETDAAGRFRGLRKLVLDAPHYDRTLLHERLAFDFMRRYGMPYSCANNARLYLNGEYYGLFANLERVNGQYLDRHFEESDGNLYKEGLELKTNEDGPLDTTRIDAFWAATTLSEIEALVDVPHAVDLWAGLAVLPDPDSYWAGVEINFYLYDHPTRGFVYLPYDMDTAFGWEGLESVDPILHEHDNWQRELHLELVLSDTGWCGRYLDSLEAARQAYDVDILKDKLDLWAEQISTAMQDDPNRQYSYDEHLDALEETRDLIDNRAAFMDEWLRQPGHCPPSW